MLDQGPAIARLTVSELKRRFEEGGPLALLDVRESDERAYCAIPSPAIVTDLHIPIAEIPLRLDEIRDAARTGPLVVYCHHGVRSMMAARWLAARGVPNLHNLDGGIDAYSLEVDPDVPRY